MSSRKMIGVWISIVLATASTVCSAGDWKFPVGLTYVSGFADIVDYHEDQVDADTSYAVPVGLSFSPHYEFDYGGRLGIQLGPIAILMYDAYGDESDMFVDVPFILTFGHTLLPKASVSPYVRAGLAVHLVTGDFVGDETPGFFVAGGVEFMRDRPVALQLEAAYDSATVETASRSGPEDTELHGLTISIRAVF
jgi:hypothetical protein